MDEIDFEVLRRQYVTALDAYNAQARTIAERSKNGVRPAPEELRDEEQSLYHFAMVRRQMLDALTAIQHRR
jgi:hypothetical protein